MLRRVANVHELEIRVELEKHISVYYGSKPCMYSVYLYLFFFKL